VGKCKPVLWKRHIGPIQQQALVIVLQLYSGSSLALRPGPATAIHVLSGMQQIVASLAVISLPMHVRKFVTSFELNVA